jgi:hypothetical protein
MSRSGLTSPPAIERRDDLAGPDPVGGRYWRRPHRRAVCLLSVCAGALVVAGVACVVTGLQGADRPARYAPVRGTSAVSRQKPTAAARPEPGTLPASGVRSAVSPQAPTASAFPVGQGTGPSVAPRRSPAGPAGSPTLTVSPPAYPGRSPSPIVPTVPMSPTSTPSPPGSGSPTISPSGSSSPSVAGGTGSA